MKNIYSTILLMSILLFVISENALSQQFAVVRAERPEIDLRTVPEQAYEQNVLLIKLAPTQDAAIEAMNLPPNQQGFSVFGIPAVDQLNDYFSVETVEPYFFSTQLMSDHVERHKAWGFHRWFKLRVKGTEDLVDMIMAYRNLSEVDLAEPVFKKKSVGIYEARLEHENMASTSTNNLPNDPFFVQQWNFHNTGQYGGTVGADINLLQAWEIEQGNKDVIVAIIDHGIQIDHTDLVGNIWEGIGYNFVNNSSTIVAGNRGTHTAGIVAASTNNMLGVAGIAGGFGNNKGVHLMSCQVFSASSMDGFHLAPIFAADNGAAIAQNNWIYAEPGVYNYGDLDAIDYFNLNGGGDVMIGGLSVFPAGIDNSSGMFYPGCYSETLAVTITDNKDQKTYYANYDTWVDISAPGGDMILMNETAVLNTFAENGYGFVVGNGPASGHASGAAALILSKVPGLLTAQEVKDILISTADDHYDVNPNFIGKLGSGRLNLFQALMSASSQLIEVDNPSYFTASAIDNTTIDLNWSKNDNEDQVLILWSTNNTFGLLQNGIIYNESDAIAGGGTVLYKGATTNFEHSNLSPNVEYFYKAVSYDGSNNYSIGLEANARTIGDI